MTAFDPFRPFEVVDALFIGGALHDELLKNGMIEAGFLVGRFGVGIGVRKGTAQPNVSTAEAV